MNRYLILCQYGPEESTDGYTLPVSRDEALKMACENEHAAIILEITSTADGKEMGCLNISKEMADRWFEKNSAGYFAEEMPVPQFIERYISPRKIAEMRDEAAEETRFERNHIHAYSSPA